MKVPKAKKQPSGNWFIQLRLGGKSIPITAATERACTRDAQAIKATYLAGKQISTQDADQEDESTDIPTLTLTAAIDAYISSKDAILSPSTLRGYRTIQRNRFQSLMEREISGIQDEEWQGLINEEAKLVGPTTVKKAFTFIRTVILHQTGHSIPVDRITMPEPIPAVRAYLTPDEIPKFVAAVKNTEFAVPALLALSSLRISEIAALCWQDIPKGAAFIRVAGAVIPGPDHKYRRREQNKNRTSTRNVPVLIPELAAALERDRRPTGDVMPYSQTYLREGIHRICREAGITDVTVHGLRHSFASLAYYKRVPERVTMEIGGWADTATMQKIYTHIAQSDINRYETELAAFYNPALQNANKNANEKQKP